MGVRYMTKLVESQKIYKEEWFGGKRLVIDGSNLVYHLYFTSNLDQNHGGEYGAFKDLVEQFFGALKECHISPYVIFDGCSDSQKWDTERERGKQRIEKAHKAAETGKAMGILPTLIWEVFRQTLEDLPVPLARCYTEADRQVAALAQTWNCPVLSNDSDFFIFPLKGGMLPTAHFSSLGVVDPVKAMNTALQDIPEAKEKLKKLKSLQQANNHYKLLPDSPLIEFFSKGTIPLPPSEMAGKVPDWMRDPVTNAQFSSDFLDVVTSQRVGLSVVVDHKDKPSANLVSLPLRSVLYGLLLGRDSCLTVEERDRDGLEVQYNKVQPEKVPFCIKSLDQISVEQRGQVLLDALGLDRQFQMSLPSHLSHLALPMAATCYWLMKATPPPHPSLLKALLIGWYKGGDLRSKAAKAPESRQKLNLDWCHWLNEWQSCFRDSFLLNQLLRAPLPQPKIAK